MSETMRGIQRVVIICGSGEDVNQLRAAIHAKVQADVEVVTRAEAADKIALVDGISKLNTFRAWMEQIQENSLASPLEKQDKARHNYLTIGKKRKRYG